MKHRFLALLLLVATAAGAQKTTRKDSLQGGLRPERTAFDVRHYNLDLRLDIDKKTLRGYNDVAFVMNETASRIQLDLFENMKVDSIVMDGRKLKYKREYHAVFINFPTPLEKDSKHTLRFHYHGAPQIAKNAPWDGGFVFSQDGNGKPWIGVAVQGTGASLWYPVKDSQSDEPEDGATIAISVPDGLMGVSNGRFVKSEPSGDGYTKWSWRVVNPINNYDITLNVGDYVHFGETYGTLDLDYYVLRENEEKARRHFEIVKPMLDCFQSKFGPYPFPEDGYKLVETPYLGMEHQSAVAYGNQYRNGYLGMDISGTGYGSSWDYIIVHESGHEWFGNSITSEDIADMWIHEGFTCYTETVFVECTQGKAAADAYNFGQRGNIENDKPVIGPFGVNREGSGDMYPKGANMLNTIRNIINDDGKWWSLLYDFSTTFRHKIINTETVVRFFNEKTGMDLTRVFNQYLRHKEIPVLELRRSGEFVEYRWDATEPGFDMPVDISWNGKTVRLTPTSEWKLVKLKISGINAIDVQVQRFLVNVRKL
ncbi:MAG TPA: M1 family metallopeptidase [Flavobacterium sp.]|nr:M1 family metallopeptidase [Flavobacterium sp.]